MRPTKILLTLTVSLISLLTISCSSSGPKGPEPGTPAFYWQGAKETFAAKDYMKTLDNLDRAAKDAELGPKAAAWALIVDAGLIRGYNDMADEFEMGARANRNNPGAFRKLTSDYRRLARPLSLQMAERYMAIRGLYALAGSGFEKRFVFFFCLALSCWAMVRDALKSVNRIKRQETGFNISVR